MRMWSIGAQPIGIMNMISEPNPINADGRVANQMPRPQKHVTAISVVLVFAVQAYFVQVYEVNVIEHGGKWYIEGYRLDDERS